MMSPDINNIDIINVKGTDCCCIIHGIISDIILDDHGFI